MSTVVQHTYNGYVIRMCDGRLFGGDRSAELFGDSLTNELAYICG